MNLQDLSIDHDYYASGSNYYDNSVAQKYDTWADFYEEYHDADIDMNLIYRWDIKERKKSKKHRMEVFIIGQRKGLYIPVHINYVDEDDVPQILEFMKPHFEKLLSIWNPLSSEYLKNNN